MDLKIVSINIEDHKHLGTVAALIAQEEADVVCLMEACEVDLNGLAGEWYPYQAYAPNDILSGEAGTTETLGVAILSKTPIDSSETYYCEEEISQYLTLPGQTSHMPALLLVKTAGVQIGAVHFSWTPDGKPDARQRAHLPLLLEYLGKQGEFVLCGDFNIPRGSELYLELAQHYHNNIPEEITTTIDPDLHRANFAERGKLALVVDYVWSTPTYTVRNVRVVPGVSDHYGVICELGSV